MNTLLTEDTQAITLLCGIFGRDRSVNTLSLTEYSSLVRWLISVNMRPGDLLQHKNIAEAAVGSGIDTTRLELLLGRGVQLGFAVEEWQRNGIWMMSRSDTGYPIRYKKHLKNNAPPLLFGVGDHSLLNGGGLGILGLRNTDEAGEAFTRQVAELCACNQIPVVSSGSTGVDQMSLTTALQSGGMGIAVLADNLFTKSVERDARRAIADGRLLLLSPFHPGARFSAEAAIARNKLIYATADYGLVVSAEYKKGDTWASAEEELQRENARPLFVRTGPDTPPGNSTLLNLGAIPWPQAMDHDGFRQQLFNVIAQSREMRNKTNPSLFDF